VKNAEANAKITIFDVAAKGVYIVKVNSEVFKVINN
jgi:hypothetical protein